MGTKLRLGTLRDSGTPFSHLGALEPLEAREHCQQLGTVGKLVATPRSRPQIGQKAKKATLATTATRPFGG